MFISGVLNCTAVFGPAVAGKDVRCLTFELTPLSMHSLSVTFEHPWRDKIISGKLSI